MARLVRTETLRLTVVDWSLASDRSAVARGMYDMMTTDLRARTRRDPNAGHDRLRQQSCHRAGGGHHRPLSRRSMRRCRTTAW